MSNVVFEKHESEMLDSPSFKPYAPLSLRYTVKIQPCISYEYKDC